jgi:hypothetical protein
MASSPSRSPHATDIHDDPGDRLQHGIDGDVISGLEPADEAPVHKKRRGPNVQREWVEVNHWMRGCDFGDDRIRQLINVELRELATKSGGFYALRRQNRVTKSSEWEEWCFRRQWSTNHGFIVHTMLNCPFAKHTGCQCHIKIVETPKMVVMTVADMHSADDHLEDKRKLLSNR